MTYIIFESYANTDPSLHFNRIDPPDPDWRDEYMRLLMDEDYEGAHQLRTQHDERYARDTKGAVVAPKAGHAPVRSCREVELERDEAEWVAQQEVA